MRKKRRCLLWILFVPVLILLYLLSSTDLLIQERTKEVYPVSVMLDSVTDEAYANFKKGMDRAAVEYNADVTLITLYEEGDAAQQMERMVREQQDGVRALIVIPVQEKELEQALTQKQVQLPLVLVHSDLTQDPVSAVVRVDYEEMGRKLAEEITAEQGTDVLVYLLGSGRETTSESRFAAGLESVLSEKGTEIQRFGRQGAEALFRQMEEPVDSERTQAILVALSPELLAKTASILEENPVYADGIKGLYGRGTTPLLLHYLDRGVISGLCVTDDFSIGYFSVCRAVERLKNQKPEEKMVLESYYIKREDLRKPEYEKLLYPME